MVSRAFVQGKPRLHPPPPRDKAQGWLEGGGPTVQVPRARRKAQAPL